MIVNVQDQAFDRQPEHANPPTDRKREGVIRRVAPANEVSLPMVGTTTTPHQLRDFPPANLMRRGTSILMNGNKPLLSKAI